jgi:hypothetical protein
MKTCSFEARSQASVHINNKLISTRQNNQYLLQYIGYMFRPGRAADHSPPSSAAVMEE